MGMILKPYADLKPWPEISCFLAFQATFDVPHMDGLCGQWAMLGWRRATEARSDLSVVGLPAA